VRRRKVPAASILKPEEIHTLVNQFLRLEYPNHVQWMTQDATASTAGNPQPNIASLKRLLTLLEVAWQKGVEQRRIHGDGLPQADDQVPAGAGPIPNEAQPLGKRDEDADQIAADL